MINKTFIIAACVALAVVAIATMAPLSTSPVRIIQLHDAPDSITLEPGRHMSQRLHLSKGTYSAVSVFSDATLLEGRVLRAVIKDRKGNAITSGSANTTAYLSSENVMKIEIPVTWFTVDHDDFYVMDISLLHGEALPLRMMARDTNMPKVHRVAIDGEVQQGMLPLLFIKQVPAVFGLKNGMIIGAAFLLAVALISFIKNERNKYIAAIIIIVVFAPLATMGYFLLPDNLGIADWDFYFALHDSYRAAIVTHHTFPLWDPYPCGGTAGLSDPEFPMFSPTFALELIFGVPLGVRLAIALSVIVGATGMLTLARSLGRSVEAGLIASLAVAFGTVNLLEITEGHVNVFAAMWIPWILWAWLSMYRGKVKPIVCGAFLALTFLGGGIYLLMYTTLAFAALMLFVRHRKQAAILTIRAAAWAMGFAAFKLVPVLFWLKQFPDDAYASSTYTLPWIVDILFGRHLHGSYVILDQASGWHEYGAYIGYIVFALALIGLSYIRKSRIVKVLAFASVAVVLVSTMGPYLKPIFDLLWFFPRSNISRIILFAVIPLGLLASYGADKLASMVSRSTARIVLVVCVGLIAVDIFSLTYQVSEQAFTLPHVVPNISPAPYPIAFTPDRYDENGDGSRTTRSFDAYKAGYGTMVYCSVLGPRPAVRTIYDEGDTSVVSAVDPAAKVTLVSWSYNLVRAHAVVPNETFVVLNTNYADGWTANGKKADIVSDLVAMKVAPGEYDITFAYNPPGVLMGASISFFTFLFLFVRTVIEKRSKKV